MADNGASMDFTFRTNAKQTFPEISEATEGTIEAFERLRALGDIEIGAGLADGIAELPGQVDQAVTKVQDSFRRLASGTDLGGIGKELGSSLRELQEVIGRIESAGGGSRNELALGMENALRAGRELLSIVRQVSEIKPAVAGSVTAALNQAGERNLALGSGQVIDGEVVARSNQRLADENTRQAEAVRQGTQTEQRLNQVNEKLIQEKEGEVQRIAERAQQSSPFSHPEQTPGATPRTGAPAASPFLPQPPPLATPRTGAPAASPFLPQPPPLATPRTGALAASPFQEVPIGVPPVLGTPREQRAPTLPTPPVAAPVGSAVSPEVLQRALAQFTPAEQATLKNMVETVHHGVGAGNPTNDAVARVFGVAAGGHGTVPSYDNNLVPTFQGTYTDPKTGRETVSFAESRKWANARDQLGQRFLQTVGQESAGGSELTQDAAALNGHARAVQEDTEVIERGKAAAQEFFATGGNGRTPPPPRMGTGGGGGGDDDDGNDPNKGRYINEADLSREDVVQAARTGARGIRQIGNTASYILPEHQGVYRYESGGETEEGGELPGGWRQIVDKIVLQRLANLTKPYELGPEGEDLLGDYRKLGRRTPGGFDWTETTQSQYALGRRLQMDQAPHGGYDPSLGYGENVRPDFSPVGNSTTLFRDLNGELLRINGDLASYATTIKDQITASRSLTQEELHRVETERGANIAAGLPGFEQIGGPSSKFFNTPEGAPAFLGAGGRATIDFNPAQQLGAQKAQADARKIQEEADKATEEKATADRIYSQTVRDSARLNNIAKLNPADELRDLGSGYMQLGQQLYRRTQNGLRLIEGEEELYQASFALAHTLEKQGRAHIDQGVFQSFLGGAFGHGFESNQQFKPQDAIKNLAGTAGVLARYGGEGRLLFGAVDGIKQSIDQVSQMQTALIELQHTQEATGAGQVGLNEAFRVGAQYGLNEVDSLKAGTAGLKVFADQLRDGKSAADIFRESVEQVGIASAITGQDASKVQGPLMGTTNEFNLGFEGQGRINDAYASAARRFNVDPTQILTGMQEAGDLANVSGFTPEKLANTIAAVDQQTGKDSAPQIVRDLAQGGSSTTRSALASLGVGYNAGDVSGTIERAGAAYAKLNDAQRTAFATQLGGARTAETVIALFKAQADIVEATAKSYEDQGKAMEEAHQLMGTFGGEMKQLHTLITDLTTDLGKMGFVQVFGAAVEAVKPAVQLLDNMAGALDHLPSSVRGAMAALVAFRAVAAFGGASSLFSRTGGLTGIRGGTIANAEEGVEARTARQNFGAGLRRIGRRGRAEDAPAEDSTQTTQQKAHTEAVKGDATATEEHTQAVRDNAAAQTEGAAAATEETTARYQDYVSLEELIAAQNAATAQVSEEIAARGEMIDQEAAWLEANQALMDAQIELMLSTRELTTANEEAAVERELTPLGGGGGGRGFLPGGAGGWAMAGLVTAMGVQAVLDTRNKVDQTMAAGREAENQSLSSGTADPDADRKLAEAQNTSAQKAAEAQGGIIGSIVGYLTGGHFDVKQAREAAQANNDLASQLEANNQAGADAGTPASLDITSKVALDNSVKALQDTGATAGDVLNALTAAMKNMAGAGAGAVAALNVTDQKNVAAVGANNALGALRGDIDVGHGLDTKTGIHFGLHPRLSTAWDNSHSFAFGSQAGSESQQRDSAKHDFGQLQKVDQKVVSDKVNSAIQDFLAQDPGYDSTKDQHALIDFIDDQLRTIPELAQTDDRTTRDIATQAASGVRGAAQAVQGSSKAPPTPQVVQEGFALRQQQIEAEGPDVGAMATVGDYSGIGKIQHFLHPEDSPATAQARWELDQSKKNYEDALNVKDKSGKRVAKDSQIQHDKAIVDQKQAAFDKDVASDLDDQVKINQANRALTDELGQGQDAIDGLVKKLAAEQATNPYQFKLDTAALTTLRKQRAALVTQTEAAGISVGINDPKTGAAIASTRPGANGAQRGASYDPRDELGNAQRQEAGDLLIFNQIDAAEKGLPQHSKAWIDAYKAVQNDKTAIAQDEVDVANAAIDASARAGDSVQAAANAITKARNQLNADRPGSAKAGQDQAALNAAVYANAQKQVELANAQTAARVFPGDEVGAAEAQITQLNRQLAAEHDPVKWWQEWGQLQQEKVTLAHAEIDAASVANTLRSDTTDPVAMARIAADKARATLASDAANPKLTGAARTRVLNTDTLAERQAQNAQEAAAFQQWLSDTQTNMQLGRTSFATYMQLLESRDSMLKAERARMKVGSDGYRQLTDEINQTETTIHDAMNQLAGQFNLGDIKLPTLYEVRRSNATAQAGTGYNDNRTVSIVINGVGSTQEVVQIVKQQLGTRATVTTAPTSTRKG